MNLKISANSLSGTGMRSKLHKLLKSSWFLLVILIIAGAVRFYNFSDRITFGPEQAISLIVSGDYINEKFSLLGLPSTQRTTSFGHIIFYPPNFNYSLIPVMMIANYDVVKITMFFALLNLFTGLLIYIFINKVFSKNTAIFSSAIFLFDALMINHSMFIWSVNYLPLLSVLTLYFLYLKYIESKSLWTDPAIGVLVGLSVSVEYLYLISGTLILVILLFLSKQKLRSLMFFIIGVVISLLPTIIFDLTHNFYHVNTLWQYLLDTIETPRQTNLTYYHFLNLWPLFAIIIGLFLSRIFIKSKFLAWILLILFITVSLNSPQVSFSKSVNMYSGLNYSILKEAADNIALDNPHSFNVATTYDFDSRAHPLRYLLKYNHNLKPEGVENYPKSQTVYVLSQSGYDLQNSTLYEIASVNKTKPIILNKMNNFTLYKLTK